MREDLLKGLTEEQIAKVKACKNSEELLKLAKDEGVTLTDEQLDAISGGGCKVSISFKECPYCGSTWLSFVSRKKYKCMACNRKFED